MERYKQGTDKRQTSLVPMCLDDMISPENPFRAIEAIVERMDIPKLGFLYTDTKTTGQTI